MNAVKVLADSTSDLSPELIQKYDIGIIPLYVNFGTQTFRDNVDITPKQLYARVKTHGALPTTSAPTPQDYKNEFEKYTEQGQDVIYISLSSRLSASFQNAKNAAGNFRPGQVRVIDSLNLSSGTGLLILTAVDCIQSGMDAGKTEAYVQKKITLVQSAFILDTVEYLHKGGRCSGLQMFFSSLLKIHPVIAVADGSMHLAAKVRGARTQVLQHLLKSVTANIDNIDARRVFVTHSESHQDALWLKEQLSQISVLEEIVTTEASCVISTHCGPQTVGILYLKKG
jgi:DegV family protein with EDD domain